MVKRGLMIVLEGSDGSGKTTQFNLLAERLKAAGYDVETFDFPQYNSESSYFVRQYLSGAFGSATEVSPYTASLFYALDRYEAAKSIEKALEQGKIVLADRYAGANMAYQGAKFTDSVEQRGFFVWADNLEFELLGIPRPDVNLFLRVPADVSAGLIDNRGQARDEHEKNSAFLKKSVATYDLLCRLFPKDFTAIECTEKGKLLSIPQISDLIWKKLKPILPPERPHNGHAAVVTLNGSSDSHKSNDSRQLGDDKLAHHFKDASLLLKMAIERQMESVDPPGFTVWSDNNYRFFTPAGLPKETAGVYKTGLRKIGELHQEMRRRLESYYERTLFDNSRQPGTNISSILLPVTPMAALCEFDAVFSPRAVEMTASRLLAGDTRELQWTAQQIYLAARQIWPQHFKQSLEAANNPEPLNNIISQLVEDRLSLNSGDRQDVKLLEASPRLEFDLLAESIYPYSSLSLDEISEEVSNWSYQQKYESLKNAANDPSILSKVHYKFDVISDQLTLAEASASARLTDIQVQVPSPRFGYDVPDIIEAAGIDELYMECFDESLKLFSILQRADRDDLTVYATLLGHKLRWQFKSDADSLRRLLEKAGSPALRQLTESIREAVVEKHPLTWEVLSGVSQTAPIPKSRQNRVKPAKRRRPKSKRPTRPSEE
jgi:dTMP kinase